MSDRSTTRALDACEPIVVWEPDPTCDHEVDCDHGLWVETRVTRDALARGTVSLSIEPVVDDDAIVAAAVTLTCDLQTGACTPDGRDGAIFLREHPWVEGALRAELGLLQRRAQRAAAQADRETSARLALAKSDGTTMVGFGELFPADWDFLLEHDDERYYACDLYCANPSCACSSSIILLHHLGDESEAPLVGEIVIDYAAREPDFKPSSPLAAAIFEVLWARAEYKLRARHEEAREAVKRFARPRAVGAPAPRASTAAAASGRISRNDPCPCGSGKKYKRCCLDAAPGLSRVAAATGGGPATTPR